MAKFELFRGSTSTGCAFPDKALPGLAAPRQGSARPGSSPTRLRQVQQLRPATLFVPTEGLPLQDALSKACTKALPVRAAASRMSTKALPSSVDLLRLRLLCQVHSFSLLHPDVSFKTTEFQKGFLTFLQAVPSRSSFLVVSFISCITRRLSSYSCNYLRTDARTD